MKVTTASRSVTWKLQCRQASKVFLLSGVAAPLLFGRTDVWRSLMLQSLATGGQVLRRNQIHVPRFVCGFAQFVVHWLGMSLWGKGTSSSSDGTKYDKRGRYEHQRKAQKVPQLSKSCRRVFGMDWSFTWSVEVPRLIHKISRGVRKSCGSTR